MASTMAIKKDEVVSPPKPRGQTLLCYSIPLLSYLTTKITGLLWCWIIHPRSSELFNFVLSKENKDLQTLSVGHDRGASASPFQNIQVRTLFDLNNTASVMSWGSL